MPHLGIAFLTLLALSTAAGAETGIASYYGMESCRHHRPCRTASGEHFTGREMTCASRRYRKGIRLRLRVTVLATGRSIVCRVNDYGPAARTGRIVDLSERAARELGIIRSGTARVTVEPALRK